MANESGSGGGGKYRGKKRKSGVRKTGYEGFINQPPRAGDAFVDPSIYYNQTLGIPSDLLAAYGPEKGGTSGTLPPPDFTTPSERRTQKEPSGGYTMQKVEPPTTMRPKPAQRLDQNAAMGNDGYDPTQAFMDLATSMLTQPGASFDYETAQREAANAIRQAYGAEIAAIRQNNRVARKSSKNARKEIENLYKGLARMYGKQEMRADKRGQRSADRQMGIAEEGAGVLEDLNRQMIGEESQMLQDLGQQQAAQQLISPDYDRMGEQVGQITEQGTRAASQAERMGQNNARWFDRAQGGARLEGTNAQADMIAQLQSYLMNNRNQIAGLRGDRAQEVAASNMNIESQAAQAANDAQQQTFDNVLKLLGVQTDIENTNQDNQRADAEFRWDKKMDRKNLRLKMLDSAETGNTDSLANYDPGIRDAMSIIAQEQDPNDKKATTALWKLFASNAWQDGEVPTDDNSGQTLKMTPYRAAALARKKGMAMGLRGKELSDFINAAAASV